MSKIRIRNFGPIKNGLKENDGWIEIKKNTIFIGNQGSGKSTVAKLISTLMWIEKAITRGDRDPKYFERSGRFRDQFLTYHRLENYFLIYAALRLPGIPFTDIEYIGDSCEFQFINGEFLVLRHNKENNNYDLPQIMYVPAERNFAGSFKEGRNANITSASLREFTIDYSVALDAMDGPMRLPINDADVEYSQTTNTVTIKKPGFQISLAESSSGFQSLVPLYISSSYMANLIVQSENAPKMTVEQSERFRAEMQSINDTPGFSEEQKRIARSEIGKKFNKKAFINIVEEPEQNLYPSSQTEMLNSLLRFNNSMPGNKLIVTTHSPYLINDITLCVEAYHLLEKIKKANKEATLGPELEKIVPLASVINPDELVIYELDEKDGSIQLLGNYRGLPSDENKLNTELGTTNNKFSELLRIEDLCR